ncbi:hypothetical protein B0I37DRAFT_373149 [Chaetomium sp. MPI-CAGE-AT-0009]|nr:hypothetical protein B0I37DRAFT_373149 [Chaetomium sp. MPI-CAGE-AT-0009]
MSPTPDDTESPLSIGYQLQAWGSNYLTLAGFKTDGAGMTAAWSGVYTLLAARRRPASLRSRFSARGMVRGSAMALGAANTGAGFYTYAMGDRKREEAERREVNRWGFIRTETRPVDKGE